MTDPTNRDEGGLGAAGQTLRDVSPAAPTTRLDGSVPARATSGGLLRLPEALADRYRIERELQTRGSEADLLVAQPLDGGLAVVIKLYRANIHPKPEILAQLAALDPRHTVNLLDHGQSEGRSYEVMEYAAAGSLADLLREAPDNRLARPVLDEVIRQVSGALSYLHGRNPPIIHRDIKPDNVLVRSQQPLDLILADFGLASLLEGSSWRATTADRTVRYAAPEAADGQASVGLDWWSLGMLVAEAAAGRHPFANVDEQAIRIHYRNREPIPLDAVAEERVRLLCRGLLVYDRKRRWGAAEVGRWLAGDTALVPPVDEAPMRGVAPFKFAGGAYASPRELAAAMVANWQDASRVVARATVLRDWLTNDAKEHDIADWLGEITETKAQLDAGMKVTLLLPMMDPALPPYFRGAELTRDRLSAEVGQAGSGSGPVPADIVQLWDHLTTLGTLTGRTWLAEDRAAVETAQREAEGLYASLRAGNSSLPVIDAKGWQQLRKFVIEQARDGAKFGRTELEARALLGGLAGKDAGWARPLTAGQPLSVGAVWVVQRVERQIEALIIEIKRVERLRAEEQARLERASALRAAEVERQRIVREKDLELQQALEEARVAAAKRSADEEAKRARNIRVGKIVGFPAIALAAFIFYQIHSYQEQAADQAAWTQAQQTNSVEAYRAYLAGSKLRTFAGQAEAAIATLDRPRDDADWQRARSLHSVDGYRAYLRRTGMKQYEQQALTFIDEGEWAEARRLNSADAYRAYLNNQPAGRYRQNAQEIVTATERQRTEQAARIERERIERINREAADRSQDQVDYQAAMSQTTPEALRRYLRRPGSKQFESEVRQMLEQVEFNRAMNMAGQTPGGDLAPLRQFLSEFPRGQFSSTVRQQMEIYAYNRASMQNSSAAMRRFIAEYPNSEITEQARWQLRSLEQQGR